MKMKQKLLMLLAVLLTGGILVACGPGNDADEIGGGGGVVDQPLGADPAVEDDALGGDVAVGDNIDSAAEAEAAAEEAGVVEDAAQVELNVDEEAAVDAQGAEDQQAAASEEPAEGGEVAGGGAAPAAGETVIVTFSQAAEGVAVENVEGAENPDQVAATGEPNPDLTLTTGQRYEFAYDGEGDLVFMNANDEELLSSAGTDSAFAQDSEVQAEAQDGRLSFTLTDKLAQEIASYTVGPEGQGGQVNVN